MTVLQRSHPQRGVATPPARWSLRRSRLLAPGIVGLLGFAISVLGSWIPSVWFDEAATISATQRTWPQLAQMLHNVDAVHGLYYAGMHVWFDLVGYTPFTLRLPSAVAVGATAGLLVVLVRMLAPARTAMIAGLLFILLPRTTWMGGEGRSYALTTLLAVAMTIVFVRATRDTGSQRPSARRRWWVLYTALAVLGSFTFLYLVLLVVAHGVSLLLLRGWARPRDRRSTEVTVRGWLIAAAVVAAIILPFALIVAGQSAQVSWIAPLGWGTWRDVFVGQWFYRDPFLAIVGWPLMLLGGYLSVRGVRSRNGERRQLATVVLPWLIVPTTGLLLVSALGSPLYTPRYLSFATPAAAVLIAVSLAPLGRRVFARADLAVALIALAALAAPQYIAQRTPEAKQHSSWSEVAAFIAAERTAPSGATSVTAPQAIIYGPVRKHLAATTRVIEYAYPEAFAGLIDVKLKTPAAETGALWETRYPLANVTDRLDGVDTVWLVTSTKQDWRPSVSTKLTAEGYSPDGEWHFTNVNVLRYTR